MATLAYPPELVIAFGDSLPSDLSEDVRDKRKRIVEQIEMVLRPLTQVRSLAAAERLILNAGPDYRALATQCADLQSNIDAPGPAARFVDPFANIIRESTLISEDAKEQLYGALESSAAYIDWFHRSVANAIGEDEQRAFAAIIQQVVDHLERAGMALTAIGLILKEPPDSTPKAIPILAELADRCWTEVEEVFLGLAAYDDDGETVPLAEVKAELGLSRLVLQEGGGRVPRHPPVHQPLHTPAFERRADAVGAKPLPATQSGRVAGRRWEVTQRA